MQEIKQFYRYVIPSVCAMLVSALYYVVDGIFVGRGVGTNGLAAVNLAWPFISIVIAVAGMVMMGGATICTIALGEGDKEKANKAFMNSLVLVVVVSIGIAIVAWTFPTQIAMVLGASGAVLEQTIDYIKFFNVFGVFFASSMVLAVFVRSDGNPMLAFWGMVIGALTNIFLDWLFIFPLQMGIVGAALASGMGQVVSFVILMFHFIRKRGYLRIQAMPIDWGLVKQIIHYGIPELITQFSMPVTMLLYNLMIMRIMGEVGVSAYAVMGYIFMIIISIIMGVAQGVQPLIGRSFGEGEPEKEKYFVKLAILFNILLAILTYIGLYRFTEEMASIFTTDQQVIAIAIHGIRVYAISFLFAAVNVIYITYFYSTKRIRYALIVSISRSLVLNTLCIVTIPIVFGNQALWLGIILCEAMTALCGYSLYMRLKMKNILGNE